MAAKKKYYGGMISEDKSQVANMPQEVIYRAYSDVDYSMMTESIDDKMSGVERQMSEDKNKGRKGANPRKV